ncbi:MAG: lipopolysaccharide biosynthesis protein [Rhodoferax sp.]|nr:lipopolysaccharide biosynthesis protein [Rhodoferax sp.]
MTSVRRALALSFVERYFTIALALGSNMVLARLLTPEQVGLYSVSLAVIGIAHVLREFGVGNFLIQQKDLSIAHVRTAFGLALAVGGGLALAIFTAAPWVARFYDAPAMAGLMRIVALNFLVLPWCTISLSLLRREMRFQTLLYVNLTASVVGTAVTLSLAWAGHGPASLAVGSVAGNLTTGFGAWWARGRPTPLRPGWSEWRAVLGFGGQSAVTGVVTTVAMDINDLVVGKVMGFAPVAILSRAQGLMNLFHRDVMVAVRNVAYPAYARTHREGGDVEAAHVTSVVMVTACAWPFYGFLALYPLDVLRLMFGPQWDAAAVLVPVFCLAGALAATSNLAMNALMAVGRIDLVTTTELVFQPLRAVVAVAAAVIFQSVLACALAYLLVFAVQPFAVYGMKQRALPTDFRRLFRGLGHSAAVAALSLAPVAVWRFWRPISEAGLSLLLEIAALASATALCWLLVLQWLRHPIARDPAFHRVLRRLPAFGRN